MTSTCSTDDIAAYVDGELEADRELELEMHLATCQSCARYLTEQKLFLQDLDLSLRNEPELELPAGFTRTVVANAESTVSGIRRPSEFYNAMFVCAALLLFVLFATGGDADRLLSGIWSILNEIAVIGSFFGHMVYSLFIGVSVIVRTLASQFEFGIPAFILLLMILGISALFFSQRILRTLRT